MRLAPTLLLLAALLLGLATAAGRRLEQASDQTLLSSPEFSEDLFAPVAPAPAGPTFGLAPQIGAPAGEPRLHYAGSATYAYTPENITASGAVGFSCGFGFVSPAFLGSFVGVSSTYYAQGYACGRCIQLQCDDASCGQPGARATAMILDLCGDCQDADLRIAAPLFTSLVGREPGSNPTVAMSWQPVPCGDLIQGTIKMLVLGQSSAFYARFNFANSKQTIVAVQINGTRLQHSTDNSWGWNPGTAINPAAALNIALQGANKQVLRVRVPSLRNADLGVQFAP